MGLDLFSTGAYARTAGGNLERPDLQKPVISWMAWSINSDNGGGGDPAVWSKCRALWDAAGIINFPWLHCRSMDDIERLIAVGKGYPAIGLNIEDVVGDKLNLQQVAALVKSSWNGQVHMPTLCWVQNGQGWGNLAFAVAALEIDPVAVPSCKDVSGCIEHAYAEGLTQVTTMVTTKNPPSTYDLSICHSLYTADDITPDAASWNAWKSAPCVHNGGGQMLTPTQKAKVRKAITNYCLRAEKFRLNRGYSQRRPVIGYGLAADQDQLDDCSGFDSKVIYRAGQLQRVHLEDPLGYHFSGYGNTESMQRFLTHEVDLDKILVGDMALWGKNDWDTTHTAICRKAGTRTTAIFTSHGHQSWRFSEDAPEPIILPNFPEHLIGVYRLPSLV